MRRIVTIIISYISILSSISCRGESTQKYYRGGLDLKGVEIEFDSLGIIKKGKIVVKDTIDLNGYTCVLPNDILLDLSNGQIRNGKLIGRNNKLKCRKGAFYRVRIDGNWNVPVIKSSFFSDISYDNAICDIIALSNAKIKNQIYIDEGDFQVTIKNPWQSAIILNSNTELIFNGTIQLTPNDYPGCNIIDIKGDNVIIKGSGKVIGDKDIHKGKKGEWGMGVNIDKSRNILIAGISVESCWGDCIYVGESKDIIISGCSLGNSRRQGISITDATNVTIKNCIITNIKGTAPEYAIDVEPNKGNQCRNISIRNVTINDCQGGVLVYGGAKNASVNNVTIQSCSLERIVNSPFRFDDADNITVKNCVVRKSGRNKPFTLINLRNYKQSKVTIY